MIKLDMYVGDGENTVKGIAQDSGMDNLVDEGVFIRNEHWRQSFLGDCIMGLSLVKVVPKDEDLVFVGI